MKKIRQLFSVLSHLIFVMKVLKQYVHHINAMIQYVKRSFPILARLALILEFFLIIKEIANKRIMGLF